MWKMQEQSLKKIIVRIKHMYVCKAFNRGLSKDRDAITDG